MSLWRWRKRDRPIPGADEAIGWLKAPAPADTRVPGPAPVPGGAASPARRHQGLAAPPCGQPRHPGHDCGPAVRLAIHPGGCVYRWSPALRKWERVHHCGRTDFDTAEWERRLTL